MQESVCPILAQTCIQEVTTAKREVQPNYAASMGQAEEAEFTSCSGQRATEEGVITTACVKCGGAPPVPASPHTAMSPVVVQFVPALQVLVQEHTGDEK